MTPEKDREDVCGGSLPWKDVLAMILAGIQVILMPLMIFAAVAAGVLFLVLALLR